MMIWRFPVRKDRKEGVTVKQSFKKTMRFLFVFSLIVVTAALTASANDHAGWTPVMRKDDLAFRGVIRDGSYYLENDLSFDDNLTAKSGTAGGTITICLNGHKLTLSGPYYGIQVPKGTNLRIEDCSGGAGVIFQPNSHALEIAGGTVQIISGRIESATSGVVVNEGSLTVSGGIIKGSTNGIQISGTSPTAPTTTTISSGVVTGSNCGIRADQGLNNTLTITDGTVEPSNEGLPCIYVRTQDCNCKVTINGGKFGGKFDPGMKVNVTGGYYKNASIGAYVTDSYICRMTGKADYPYMVGKKRLYTVVFTDGWGKMLNIQKVNEGESAAAPAPPTHFGYNFVGWNWDIFNISGEDTIVTINARWQQCPITYKKTLKKVKEFKLKSPEERTIRATWKKATKEERKKFDKYEVQYGLKKNFSDAKVFYAKKTSSKFTLKYLKKNKKYYIRIRKYKEDGNTVYVSPWIKKSVKTKK